MARPINRSISYEIITEASAMEGDAEERGWEQDREAVSLRDLAYEMRQRGIEHVEGTANGLSVVHPSDQDLRTGDYRVETTHITADAKLARRLVRLADKAHQQTYGRRLSASSHLLADAYSTNPPSQAAAGWNRQTPIWDDLNVTEGPQPGSAMADALAAVEAAAAQSAATPSVAPQAPATSAPRTGLARP